MKEKLIKYLSIFGLSFAMIFTCSGTVFAAKDASKSTPYGTLSGMISPYNSGGNKMCDGGTFIGSKVQTIKVKIEAKKQVQVLTSHQHKISAKIIQVLEIHWY